jgi:hypothetical protein
MTVKVLEANFSVRATESDHPGHITAGFEFPVYASVVVEKSGATEEGGTWTQQAVIEGPILRPLYDWTMIRYREGRDGPWLVPDEPVRPLGSADDRDAVALALHRCQVVVRNSEIAA